MSTKDRDEPFVAGGNDDESAMTQSESVPARINSSEEASAVPASRATKADDDSRGDSAPRRERHKSEAQAGFFERTAEFIRDTRTEMRRVSWPSATEVKNTTIITIIAVIFFAIYLFLVDRGWTLLIAQIERFVGWLLGIVS